MFVIVKCSYVESTSTVSPLRLARLVARGLRKRFGRAVALDGVDLRVRGGEVLGLVGPNGAGKSTLLRVIAGVLRPDEGSVTIDGQTDPTVPNVRRSIGIAPQGLALYAELSAEENVAFVARLHGLTGATLRERVDWALEVAGLRARRGQRVAELSGGMQRRLNLACSVVHDPAVLLLDEPTVGVDADSRKQLLDAVGRLAAEGHAIVFATHHMDEASRICERVVVLGAGKVVSRGTIEELTRAHGGDLEETLLALTAVRRVRR